MKNQAMQTAAHKASPGKLLPGQSSQAGFPGGKWAFDSQEQLEGDDEYCGQMKTAEPGVARPALAKGQAGQDGKLAEDDEADVADMDRHNHIGPESVPVHAFLDGTTLSRIRRSCD